MDNIKKLLLFILIIILVAVLIIIRINSNKIKEISINNISSYIDKKPYTLVYYGDISDELIATFKSFKEEYKMNIYKSNDSLDEIKTYINNKDKELDGETVYFIYDNSGLLGIISGNELNYLTEYIDKYIRNSIPTPEREYNVSTASQYIQMFNSKKTTIAVFGTNSCSYCTMLEHVINDISKDNTYEIYYYNRDRMTTTDYEQIMDLDLAIPAKCTTNNQDTSFKNGFPKPMTVVTKSGKLVGCIKGYYDKDTYLSKLKEIMEG